MTIILVALFVGSFLLGSIPFGYLMAKAKGIDIRTIGSGNIGATNVSRALGTKAALLVFALDVLKGLIPGLLARFLLPEPIGDVPAQVIWFLVGLAALFGHTFCPWLGFKGGKGIATGLGMLLACSPMVALLSFAVFLVFFAATMFVSLSSLIAAIALPMFGWFVPGEAKELVPAYLALTIFIFYKHRDNIWRLRDGTESKFKFKK